LKKAGDPFAWRLMQEEVKENYKALPGMAPTTPEEELAIKARKLLNKYGGLGAPKDLKNIAKMRKAGNELLTQLDPNSLGARLIRDMLGQSPSSSPAIAPTPLTPITPIPARAPATAKGDSAKAFTESSAESWGDKNYGIFTRKIQNTPLGASVNEYSTARAFELNGKLRTGVALDESLQKLDKNLNQVMDEAPRIPETIKVHRFVGNDFLSKQKIGSTFQEKGYTSTALDKEVIQEFMNSETDGATMSIRVPKGTKGLYLTEHVTAFPQTELLLDKNQEFRVLSRKQIPGAPVHYELELVSKPVKDSKKPEKED